MTTTPVVFSDAIRASGEGPAGPSDDGQLLPHRQQGSGPLMSPYGRAARSNGFDGEPTAELQNNGDQQPQRCCQILPFSILTQCMIYP
jgi:hypothetical protein